MGLTHHWRRPTELPSEPFHAAITDCRKVLVATELDLAGFDGTGNPVLNDHQIIFNGKQPDACEPFEFALIEFDRHGGREARSFCKTEHLPYDLFVKAVLIILHHHFAPLLLISSDDPEHQWTGAKQLVNSQCGYGESFSLSADT